MLDIHDVAAEYTHGVDNVVSLGNEFIWDAAAPGAKSDDWFHEALYRFVPGTDAPEVIYQSQSADHRPIGNIAGSSKGYVFSDYVDAPTQTGKWRVFFVSAPGAAPVELDEGDEEFNNDVPPHVAMNDKYVAWSGLRGTGDGRVAELKVVRIDDLGRVATFGTSRIDDGWVDRPSLFANELWYEAGENNWASNMSYPRVEMKDLDYPDAAPLMLGQDVRASMPAPSDELVVLKTGGLVGDNSASPGTLTIYWRESATFERLPIPGPATAADSTTNPTVGDRFVAWTDEVTSRLYVYDLAEHQFSRIAELDPTNVGGFAGRSVHGDLLAFAYWDGGDGSFVRWATLPE